MENILSNIGTQFAAVEKIEKQLFDVVKLKLNTGLEGYNVPKHYGVFKGTGGDCFGIVGDVYEPTQPKLILSSLVECAASSDVDFSQINYTEHKGGKMIRFDAPIGKISFKNMRGHEDESIVKLNVQTGFDGHTKTTMFLTTFRMICANGMKATKTEFAVSYKNVKGNVGKVLSMCEAVSQAVSQQDQLKELYTHLNSIKVGQKEVNDFLLKVTGLDQAQYNEMNAAKRKRLDAINESVAIEFNRTGATAFGLLNGITHYTNHVVDAENRQDYLYIDSGVELNDKALKFALELS